MAISFPYIYKEKSSPIEIVTWADGTPEQLAAMLQAHDNGLIDIYDYWSVGDERTEHLSAIAANPNGAFTRAMDEQDVVMVLMNEGYMSQQGIHFAVGQKDCLNQNGIINQPATTTWKNSAMRTDLNNLYYNAFSADFRTLFKQFDVLTAQTYNGYANEIVQDYVALFAEKEVLGTATNSNATEAGALSSIEYYNTMSNRIKKRISSACDWWSRSISNRSSSYFCLVEDDGNSSYNYSNTNEGVAPFVCI